MASMTCFRRLVLTTVLGLVQVAVSQDCNAVLRDLVAQPECAALQSTALASSKAAAGKDCTGVRDVAMKFFKAPVPDICCPGLRTLLTSGCTCEPSFVAMLAGLGGMQIKDATTGMDGTVRLTQIGNCARPENGGPIVNACDGTVGVCAGLPPLR